MAKNLIEQFLDFAASKLAGPIAHENIYREESTELSGVAKYLARQEMAARAKEEAAVGVAPNATSVDKYLARQVATSAKSAGAAATPEAAQEPLTGVAKYLAGQYKSVAAKPVAAAPAPAPAPEPEFDLSTSVGRYLAAQSRAAAAPASTKPAKPAAKAAAVAPRKEKIAPETVAPVESVELPLEAQHEPDTSKPASSVIHLNDGKQCQASTSKGTQCKHTTNLGHIQRTINKQKYMFSVCNQHHNESFKPFAALLSEQAG